MVAVVVGVLVVGGLGFVAFTAFGGGAAAGVPGDGSVRLITDMGSQPLPQLPDTEPEEAWSDELPGDAFFAAGVRGSTLFVLTSDLTGEYDSTVDDLTVTAYDVATGEELWDLEVDGRSGAVVVQSGDHPLLLHGTFDHSFSEDFVLTVITPDGEERWSEDYRDDDPWVTVVDGRRLLINVWGSGEREIQLLDADGTTLLDEEGGLAAIVGDRYVVRVDRDEIAVLDANGGELWDERVADDAYVTAGDGLVFVTDDDELLALDLASGAERWAVDLANEDGYIELQPIPGVGVATAGYEGTEVFDLQGNPLWDSRDESLGQLVNRRGRLVFLRVTGNSPDERVRVELLDARTGDRLARERLDGETIVYNWESRTPGDLPTADHLLVRNRDEVRVLAYDDGFAERWHVDADGDYAAGAVVIPGGIIVFGYDDGDVTMVAYR